MNVEIRKAGTEYYAAENTKDTEEGELKEEKRS